MIKNNPTFILSALIFFFGVQCFNIEFFLSSNKHDGDCYSYDSRCSFQKAMRKIQGNETNITLIFDNDGEYVLPSSGWHNYPKEFMILRPYKDDEYVHLTNTEVTEMNNYQVFYNECGYIIKNLKFNFITEESRGNFNYFLVDSRPSSGESENGRKYDLYIENSEFNKVSLQSKSCSNRNLVLKDVTLIDSEILCYDAFNAILEKCIIEGKSTGWGGIKISLSRNVLISNTQIRGLKFPKNGLFMEENEYVVIEKCTVENIKMNSNEWATFNYNLNLMITDSTFNNITANYKNAIDYYGSCLLFLIGDDEKLTMKRNTISNCKGGNGPAMHFSVLSNNSEIDIDESNVCENNNGVYGGAIYYFTGDLSPVSGKITPIIKNNNATFGGAVFIFVFDYDEMKVLKLFDESKIQKNNHPSYPKILGNKLYYNDTKEFYHCALGKNLKNVCKGKLKPIYDGFGNQIIDFSYYFNLECDSQTSGFLNMDGSFDIEFPFSTSLFQIDCSLKRKGNDFVFMGSYPEFGVISSIAGPIITFSSIVIVTIFIFICMFVTGLILVCIFQKKRISLNIQGKKKGYENINVV